MASQVANIVSNPELLYELQQFLKQQGENVMLVETQQPEFQSANETEEVTDKVFEEEVFRAMRSREL